MYNKSESIVDKLTRIILKGSSVLVEPRIYGTGDILYASEVHMIDVIGRNPGINVTEIAYKLGITKGTIPKIIRKLIQKELICRYKTKVNKKIVLFELTDKGWIAYHHHIEFHQNLNGNIIQKFNSLNEKELHFLNNIMSGIEQSIDQIIQS